MKKNHFQYGKYEMRPADYELMLKAQDGRCAICGFSPPENTRLCIDHDHLTGECRSLLCGNCNLGLGHFKDNPEFLRKAATYLEESGHPSRFYIEVARLITSR